ncbi:VOC family protein [Leisingera sp. M527]|uniref:VOC family protein n=1 Tax=unclassified Leisingera TaxID=2614906 RepID=UPI0021A308E4|nr:MULTISPECIES: VOC family protein [unclassified Leisingera]UWQ30553.1 VOC family protein [Leisingera sp. M523]UWQ34696.1 VOC family protein [Leisingera sp. M527]UWQ76655.1 VOC family protein [Leisingera sp. M658]
MPPQAPAPKAILETALYADDLDAAEEFYGRILGLERIQRIGDRHVFFRCGTSVLLIFNAQETIKPPGNPRLPVPPHGSSGPGHICFAQPRADLLLMRGRLVASGVAIEAEFDWPSGARSLYFRDPAGNSIEIAEPQLWAF